MKGTELIGYTRKTNDGEKIKLTIMVETPKNTHIEHGKDGTAFVELYIRIDKIKKILAEDLELTSVVIGVD